MNFIEANEKLAEGLNVRIPEWRGYWFKNKEGLIRALTKDGDIKDAWASSYMDRLDWEIAEGLDIGWAYCAIKSGKYVCRKYWERDLRIYLSKNYLPVLTTTCIKISNDYHNSLWMPQQNDILAEDWQLFEST